MAKGIKSFKKGMSDEDDDTETARTVEHRQDETVTAPKQKATVLTPRPLLRARHCWRG